MDPLPEHQRSVGMAGIVQPVAFESRPAHQLTEGPGEYGGAVTVAEHRTVAVNHVFLEQAVRFLALPKGTEKEDR